MDSSAQDRHFVLICILIEAITDIYDICRHLEGLLSPGSLEHLQKLLSNCFRDLLDILLICGFNSPHQEKEIEDFLEQQLKKVENIFRLIESLCEE